MILLQDCREKCGHHLNIEKYCKSHGIEIKRVRLNVGDYMFPNGKVSVDIKSGGLSELASDLHRDRLEFNKKYKKCYHDNIRLIVLVEQPITKMSEIISWKSKHSRISGKYLFDMMYDLKLSYGVEFKFCSKEETASMIIELLSENH